MSSGAYVEFNTLEGTALRATLRPAVPSDGQRGGVDVVLKDVAGREVAAMAGGRFATAGRFVNVADPRRPGRRHEIGPIDVARIKMLLPRLGSTA